LCRLDVGSTTAANKCGPTACPYPSCKCTILAACPSGATKSASTVVNPATPFYPADDTTCCPVGASLLERLVTDDHLDCTVGRPCVATTGMVLKGVNAVEVKLIALGLAGSIPPEISTLTALTEL
jgi:hypothetical protein